MRPVFGDKETIKNLDPREKLLHEGIEVPTDVQPCPYCKGKLYASFDDTWVDGDKWGAGKISLDCENEVDGDEDTIEQHCDMPYVYWLPAEQKVATWLSTIYPNFENEC